MATKDRKWNIPIEKQRGFIEEFKNIRTDFKEYADLMKRILQKAVEELGMMGFVDTRAKSLTSFSNKIIIKDKYQNPFTDMTDLCGARVVVHFKSQVDKVCKFIKENFEIDEANSLDQKSKLLVSEFGYRSIHYIVTPKKDSILGVKVGDKFKIMKAEIQVRTLAEHIWADISHDRIYKTDLKIPDEWKREAAQLSAMLENADKKFAGMASEIDSLATVYELQYENDRADIDILKLKTLISTLQDDPDECIKNSLKLSAIYRANDNFSEAVDLLRPLLDAPVTSRVLQLKLRFEYGMALAMSCGMEFDTQYYMEGIEMVKQILTDFSQLNDTESKEHAEALSYIYYRAGKLLQWNDGERPNLPPLFTHAHNIMPDNPLYLVALMESLALTNLGFVDYNISLFNTNICDAIPKLKELIEIGIKRLPAFFAIGHCYLFLNDKEGCLNAYTDAVETILNGKYLNSQSTIIAEIALIGKMMTKNQGLAEEVKLYLNIAMYLISDEAIRNRFKNILVKYGIRKMPVKTPVLFIAGGASFMDESKVDSYSEYVSEIMNGFSGTIISGGTTAGIPGLVGKVKTDLQKKAPVDFILEAYLSKKLPDDAHKSADYDNIYKTPSRVFSALDILVCWADLILNGIKPKNTILIGIDGGKIATMEYRIALSIGAKVALVAYSGRAASEFIQEKTWKDHPNLLILPNDPLTVWALVNQIADQTADPKIKKILTDKEIIKLAPRVHKFYLEMELEEFESETEDINKYKVLLPWDKLDPALQNSNIKQVVFYERILKRVGLSFKKKSNPVLFDIEAKLSKAVSDKSKKSDYETLVSLEHARWNAERLLEGWRYNTVKDITKKLSPCLVAWEKLDDDTKENHRKRVNKIPKLLANIGYEVYKLNKGLMSDSNKV